MAPGEQAAFWLSLPASSGAGGAAVGGSGTMRLGPPEGEFRAASPALPTGHRLPPRI